MTNKGAEISGGPSAMATSMMRSRALRDQLLAGVVGLACLGLAMLMRPGLMDDREAILHEKQGPEDRNTSLARLTVEFPRLTLGGFRGLLAMTLWISAEEAKNERQWTRLETAYNYIRVLQPYFVSVYVFHAWNQAYNLSAQWHDEDNKYKWVLDGLSYLYEGERFNPGAADIQLEEANMYFLKLGGAFERLFYRAHWRSDLAHLHLLEGNVDRSAPTTAALEHVKAVAIKPQFLIELREDPSQTTARKGYGIRLKNFIDEGKAEPMLDRPYGVSPYYFAYREFQRTLANPKPPTTTGLQVISAWPAMSLRLWCRDDLYYSVGELAKLYNDPAARSGDLAGRAEYKQKIEELKMCYENVALAGPKALKAFEAHLERFPNNKSIHEKHMRETEYYMKLAVAEQAMLDTLDAWLHADRKITAKLAGQMEETKQKYRDAATASDVWIDRVFPGTNKNNPDIEDYKKYQRALQGRIDGLQKLAEVVRSGDSNQPVDFGFLSEATVER